MEPASSLTSFEIPAVFACKLAGKKCGNFKTGWWLDWFHPLNYEHNIFKCSCGQNEMRGKQIAKFSLFMQKSDAEIDYKFKI